MVSVFHVTNEEDRQRLRHDIGRLYRMKQSDLRSWKKRKGGEVLTLLPPQV